MDKLLAVVKSHWPAILAFAAAFWAQFGAPINAWVAAHPKYAVWSAVIVFTVGFYTKSPRQSAAPPVPPPPAP